jgi:hypothetical protein
LIAARQSRVFAGAPLLLGFAFMVGVVLTVVFPTGREFAELTGKQRVDEYSIAYLTVLTRAHPEDVHLRIVYVRQLAAVGRWDAALAALSVGPPEAATSAEVRALKMELMLARARELPPHDPAAAAAFVAVHDELRSTSGILVPSARGRELAKLALELEDPALAARFLLNVGDVEVDPAVRADAIAEAGRWLRAAGEGQRASECFRRAAGLSRDLERRAAYAGKGADALEADGRPCEAAALLRPHASASTNVVVVERAAALSTSCGASEDAKTLGRRALALAPHDEVRLRAQVHRELAAGDPQGALVLLRRLVHQHPHDGDLRRTTARVAEWAGRPDVALEQWLSLFAVGPAH